jgi:phenylalanine-4-hydroxylase
MVRLTEPASRQFVADVFWFSGEFGVVREAGAWKAYGAGLLSSFGELGAFARHARIEPLDIGAMGTLPYDISQYQPRLFGADSIQEVLDVVGGFFADCTDASIARLRRSRREVHA